MNRLTKVRIDTKIVSYYPPNKIIENDKNLPRSFVLPGEESMANTSSKNKNSSTNKSNIRKLTNDFDSLDLLQKLQVVVDTVPQSIFWKNLNSEWVWGNARFVSDAGASTLDEILGKNDLSYENRPWTREQGEAFIRDDRDVLLFWVKRACACPADNSSASPSPGPY